MARDGLLLFVCVGLLAGAATRSAAAEPAADRENKVVALLAVQRALREGREQLQRGNFQAAVFALESQIARANANPEYLAALCDAYRGYLVELKKTGRLSEMPKYQERLEILDPAAGLGRKGETSVAAAAPAAASVATPGLPPPPFPASRPFVTEGRAAAAAPAPNVARAKLQEEDDDPFSDANASPQAAGILARAEEEYAARRYETASRLYEQASRASEPLTDASREHWGYCKLVCIADSLRRPTVTAAPADLEREVHQAMSMTPKLDSFGKDLLKKLQDRQSAVAVVDTPAPSAVQVRHTPAREGYWAVAETTNFRILHLQNQEFAEKLARSAEATRAAMIRKWFGDDPGPWSPRCDIFIYATAQDYVQATGAPANSPGHSTMKTEGERVISRRIDLHADDPNMSVGVLPHETTHVVLAGRFGNHAVPRWADEGMAVLSEPRDRIERHLRNLPQHRADRHLFGTGQLMKLDAYPDPRYIGPFYAQSVSLVEYLSEKAGPRVFAKFLREGLDGGYEVALQKYYGVQSFAQLEQQWLEHTFAASTASAYGQ
jgi:tetratricopeptide (TPR) repeat protein